MTTSFRDPAEVDRSREPPPGPPWDLPVAEAPLCFVDLEMTGLGPNDRVIEICIERVRGGVVEGSLDSLVRPDDGAFGNAAIHGITEEQLAGAPTFAEIADRAFALLDGAVFIAHAARWDVDFLRSETVRLGRPFPVRHWLDTLSLSRRAFARESHALSSLAKAFEIDPGRAHRANDDVKVLRQVFERVSAELRPTTPRDLFHVRVGERSARPEVIERAKTAAESGQVARIRYRPSKKPVEEFDFRVSGLRNVSAETDSTRAIDPPIILGYLLPGRGRRELRADRILSIELGEPATPGQAANKSGKSLGSRHSK